jgi:hypothetical protein
VQHLHQAVLGQLFAQLRLFEIIGEEIFDAAKACGARRSETVDERHLSEQHGEIGGKSGHGKFSRCKSNGATAFKPAAARRCG